MGGTERGGKGGGLREGGREGGGGGRGADHAIVKAAVGTDREGQAGGREGRRV